MNDKVVVVMALPARMLPDEGGPEGIPVEVGCADDVTGVTGVLELGALRETIGGTMAEHAATSGDTSGGRRADPLLADDELRTFLAVFQEVRPRLLALAYRILGDREEAEDALQDAAIKTAHHWPKAHAKAEALPASEPEKRLKVMAAFFFRTTQTVALDRVKKRKRRPEIPMSLYASRGAQMLASGVAGDSGTDEGVLMGKVEQELYFAQDVADRDPTTQAIISREELQEMWARILAVATDQQRAVVALSLLGKEPEEVARALHITVHAITVHRGRLMRAVRTGRQRWD